MNKVKITYYLQLSKTNGEWKKCLCEVTGIRNGKEKSKSRHIPKDCIHWIGEYHNGILNKRHEV